MAQVVESALPLLFPLIGVVVFVVGVWNLSVRAPRARARAGRAVRTTGTVVGSEVGKQQSGEDTVKGFVPVVEWRGPDGQVRTRVPASAALSANPPPVRQPIAVSYDPLDLGWLAVSAHLGRGGIEVLYGVLAVVVGVSSFLVGGGPSLVTGLL